MTAAPRRGGLPEAGKVKQQTEWKGSHNPIPAFQGVQATLIVIFVRQAPRFNTNCVNNLCLTAAFASHQMDFLSHDCVVDECRRAFVLQAELLTCWLYE